MLQKFFILTLTLILVGCGLNAPTATPASKSGVIRVGFPTNPDTGDVPSLMAQELLQAQGYTVQNIIFATPDLEVAALSSSDVDITNGSTRTHWAAAEKGVDVVTLMEQAGNVWSLVARAELTGCADLDGKRFGVQSAGSISNALLQAYFKRVCPNAKPQTLFIQGSDVRAAAMDAGEIDASPLQIADITNFNNRAPGKYAVLFDFAKSLPQLKTNGVYTRRAFAMQNPEMVRDYIRAVLTVHRNIQQNPQLLYDALVKQLKMEPATAKAIGDTYLAHNIWKPNGDFSLDDAKYTLDFFVEIGSIPPGLDASKITDVTYLNAVLDEIGRK